MQLFWVNKVLSRLGDTTGG